MRKIVTCLKKKKRHDIIMIVVRWRLDRKKSASKKAYLFNTKGVIKNFSKLVINLCYTFIYI